MWSWFFYILSSLSWEPQIIINLNLICTKLKGPTVETDLVVGGVVLYNYFISAIGVPNPNKLRPSFILKYFDHNILTCFVLHVRGLLALNIRLSTAHTLFPCRCIIYLFFFLQYWRELHHMLSMNAILVWKSFVRGKKKRHESQILLIWLAFNLHQSKILIFF